MSVETAVPRTDAPETSAAAPTAAEADQARRRAAALTELGTNEAEVEEAKRTYGRVAIARIGGRYYLYRGIYRSEFKGIRDLKGRDPADIEFLGEERIAARCTLKPKLDEESLRNGPAGLAGTLSTLILSLSDFDADEAPIEL